MSDPPAEQFSVGSRGGVMIRGEASGEGPAVVLLHGLTATRRYVVMGSRLLQRSGYRVVAYDARGHGRSDPAREPDAYGYGLLAEDLRAVLDQLQIERAVLVGASMGAHTAVRLALSDPARVCALCLITPAFEPASHADVAGLAIWDALARGLRENGIDGFLEAYDLSPIPPAWRPIVEKVIRQRLSQHEHPLAVADALEATPRSQPFTATSELADIRAPTLIIASRDEADPGHPLATAEGYRDVIAGARLVVEERGSSPLAWQGGQVSRLIVELADQTRT